MRDLLSGRGDSRYCDLTSTCFALEVRGTIADRFNIVDARSRSLRIMPGACEHGKLRRVIPLPWFFSRTASLPREYRD